MSATPLNLLQSLPLAMPKLSDLTADCHQCGTSTSVRMLDITKGLCRRCFVDIKIAELKQHQEPNEPVDLLSAFKIMPVEIKRDLIQNECGLTKCYLFGLMIDELGGKR